MEELDLGIPPATTRRCGTCGEHRELAMFYEAAEKRRAKVRGYDSVKIPCRVCVHERNWKRMQPRRDYIDAVKIASGCMDCGLRNPDHPEIYDFDHRPGETKVRNVALFAMSGTMDALKAEIAKCDVVCANCHRMRTRARGNTKPFGKSRA
jgi:hypothetical protein